MAGQGPITGNFGHFMVYAPDNVNRDYAVTRYGMEVQRLCSVLENQLSDGRKYILGDESCLWIDGGRGASFCRELCLSCVHGSCLSSVCRKGSLWLMRPVR